MKCPICIQLELKSTLNVGSSWSTVMNWQPYYDEEGNYHDDDPNTITTDYRCSNDHKFAESTRMGNSKIMVYKPKDFILEENEEG